MICSTTSESMRINGRKGIRMTVNNNRYNEGSTD